MIMTKDREEVEEKANLGNPEQLTTGSIYFVIYFPFIFSSSLATGIVLPSVPFCLC